MPTFHIHFSAERNDPFPPIESLPTIDVSEPLTREAFHFALRDYLEAGRGPHDRMDYRWARIVLNCHPNGDAWQFISQEVQAAELINVEPVKPPSQI
jgi:hypothetical protein